MLNLDTHIVIFALIDKLTARERKLLINNSWSISAIVLWEIEKLFQLERTTHGLSSPEFSRMLNTIHVWPIDVAVCRNLGALDFQSDPADEIIAATSLTHNVPLLTRDRKLFASRVIPLAS